VTFIQECGSHYNNTGSHLIAKEEVYAIDHATEEAIQELISLGNIEELVGLHDNAESPLPRVKTTNIYTCWKVVAHYSLRVFAEYGVPVPTLRIATTPI
jgi:hypothetical protein